MINIVKEYSHNKVPEMESQVQNLVKLSNLRKKESKEKRKYIEFKQNL